MNTCRAMHRAVAALLMLCLGPSALAAPPPAPEVNVAATDIKQLEFQWEPVRGAQRYELWFRALPGAAWVKFRDQSAKRAPLFRVGISVHLLDWRQARYIVKACNIGGCTASPEIGVDGEQLPAMGFFKAPSAGERKHFGTAVALSADGGTLAVLSSETIGTLDSVPVVYVYRKTTLASGWRYEARLVPDIDEPTSTGSPFGDHLAITANGNLLAVGVFMENADGVAQSGAVHVFRRSGATWQFQQRLTGAGITDDRFGFLVKLDDAGGTLVVSHQHTATSYEPGTLEVFRFDGQQFVHDATLPSTRDSGSQGWCEGIAISGNGATLVRSCDDGVESYVQVMKVPGWNVSATLRGGSGDGVDVSYDGTRILMQDGVDARPWRLEKGTWVAEGTLVNTPSEPAGYFPHRRIALSRDGKIAALGNWLDTTVGRGPVYPPYVQDASQPAAGGVMVYERKPYGWAPRRLVKPDSGNEGYAGLVVALGNDGKTLAVGAPFDPSAARGIDGDRDDASSVFRGAVWLY